MRRFEQTHYGGKVIDPINGDARAHGQFLIDHVHLHAGGSNRIGIDGS